VSALSDGDAPLLLCHTQDAGIAGSPDMFVGRE
jgi:hypothetical protein